MLVEIQYRIDWPRGRLGYVPWWWSGAKRPFAIIDKRHRRGARKFVIKIDLEKAWKDSQRDARRSKKNKFQEFVDTLIDDILHEIVHHFQPKYMREWKAENEAKEFAKFGRWTRL